MELPISPRSHEPDPGALVRTLHASAVTLAQASAEEASLHGASLFSRSDRPDVRAVNFAASLAPVDGLDPTKQVRDILDHYAGRRATCHVILPAQDRLPAPLEQAVMSAGYRQAVRRVFLMRGFRRPARLNDSLQVVSARAVYGQLDAFYQHMATLEHHASPRLATGFARTMMDFLDDTRLEVLIGRIAGRNVATAGVMSMGQVGVIIPAWSDPSLRGQGLAATLMAHVMDLCARALFKQVILDRADHCPAIGFYEALGFQAVTSFVKYRLIAGGSTTHE